MKDNRNFITISLPTSYGNHFFVGIEGNSGSVYMLYAAGSMNLPSVNISQRRIPKAQL